MKKISYGERDYAFGQTILTLRSAIGLTQAGLAACLGVSRRAVAEWEAGSTYPKVDHLKHLIALGVKDQAFSSGDEAEEIRALWKAAHQKFLLDEQWLSSLLGQSLSPFPPTASQQQLIEGDTTGQDEAFPHSLTITQPSSEPRVDWGDALAVPTFYGREQELALLTQWIVHDRCHIVSILGMGGIGKSALAVTTMHRVVGDFDVVIFRSLRDALSCEALLDEWLSVFSPQPLVALPGDLESRLRLLLKYLRSFRTLLVLDNLETILQEGDSKGQFRPGFEEYKRLLRRVAETEQPSCLLLTSREKPADLRLWEGAHTPVRSLGLSGLDLTTCEQLFAETDLVGTPQELSHLAEVYSGNPLALKMVVETITDLFGGEIGHFLTEEAVVFGTITHLLDEHFVRLSALEQTILHWLAIVREPVTIEELLAHLVTPLPRIQVFEAIDGLHRRSLIERGQLQASFTLQSVVLEYMTGVLITEVASEIQQGQLHRLIEHGLLQSLAKDYIRQAQKRLLIDPLFTCLQRVYRRREALEKRLLFLLDELREWDDSAQGYGPSNLITLLRVRRGHLRGLDLSQLALRGAYLQGVEMQDTSLAGSTLRDTVFTERFDLTDAIAMSSTGQYWAAGSCQGEVRVWREGGRRLFLVWQAHTDNLFTLAFSPDERTLATGSWDGTVKLWDLQSGALLWTAWHTCHIFSVVFSPDGRTLASGGKDACIKLWDVFSGQQMQTLVSQGGTVFALAWSPDGHLLAGGGFDGSIRFWQVQENQLAPSVLTLMGHSNWVHALAFSPDGTQMASGSWDGSVKLWDMASGCELQTLIGQSQRVYGVAWSPDGRTLASSDFDGKIWLWDVAQKRYRTVLHGHTSVVHDIAFTPDSSCLLSGSEDATVRLWNVTSGQCIRTIEGYGASLHDVTWSPDGRWLASAGSDHLVTLWEVTGRTPSRELRGHGWCVRAVAWSPDGRLLASAGWDNAIRVWDPATGTCLQVLQDPDHTDTLFNDVAWSPNGLLLVGGGGGSMQGIHIWNMATYTHFWGSSQTAAWIEYVAWSPDGTRLASCESDSSSLWEVPGGTLRERFQRHQSRMLNIAWSPDGRLLASGGCSRSGGEVLVWETTGEHRDEPMRVLAGLEEAVFAVAWSLNGKVLISGDRAGRIQWWDVETGACLAMREGHQGAVLALKLAPDGKVLASCGHDSTIQLWDSESGELLRTLRRDRPYERLDITGIRGLTEAQKESLLSMGAITTVTGLGTKMF